MRMDKFTQKSREALEEAINYAQDLNNQQVEPEHLFHALLKPEAGVLKSIFEKLKLDSKAMIKLLESELKKLPQVSGINIQVYFSNRFNNSLREAQKQAQLLKDEYVSAEHFLLGGVSDIDSLIAKEFSRLNIDREKVLLAISQVRGNQRIVDENPEEKFSALEKYGQDLTSLAAKIKLDPVIGRDKEIGRLIRILNGY